MSDEQTKRDRIEAVQKLEKEGKVVFLGIDGAYAHDLAEFISQPLEGLLYDLNRLPEVIIQYADDPKWVNDYAVYQVIKRLYADNAALAARIGALTEALKPEAVEEFLLTLPFSPDSTSLEKTLVFGNIRNFAAVVLRAAALAEKPAEKGEQE